MLNNRIRITQDTTIKQSKMDSTKLTNAQKHSVHGPVELIINWIKPEGDHYHVSFKDKIDGRHNWYVYSGHCMVPEPPASRVLVSLSQAAAALGTTTSKLAPYYPFLLNAMQLGNINTKLRVCHFLAQIGHESVGLKYFEEIASGSAYEGRRDLGNTQRGDGRRFKGRGPIQLTGRANYRNFTKWYQIQTGSTIDFEARPTLVGTAEYGFAATVYYWSTRYINIPADKDDVRRVTKIINGGFNGLSDRIRRLTLAKAAIL